MQTNLFNYNGNLLSEVAVHQALCRALRREGRFEARNWQREEEESDEAVLTLQEMAEVFQSATIHTELLPQL